MTTNDMKEQLDHLHNSLMYMNEAIERIAKGSIILGEAVKGTELDIKSIENGLTKIDKTFKAFLEIYNQHHSHITNQITHLDSQCKMLFDVIHGMNEIDKEKVDIFYGR